MIKHTHREKNTVISHKISVPFKENDNWVTRTVKENYSHPYTSFKIIFFPIKKKICVLFTKVTKAQKLAVLYSTGVGTGNASQ